MKGIFINIFNKFLTNGLSKKNQSKFFKKMKVATRIILVLAIAVIVFNIFQLDFDDIFSNKNTTSLITIIAGLCCILMLRIITLVNKIKNYKKR